MLPLALATAAALARGPVPAGIVRAALDDSPAPQAVLACAPLEGVLARAEPVLEWADAEGLLPAPLSPAALRDAGVDPQGALVVRIWALGRQRVDLPLLDPARPPTLANEAAGWRQRVVGRVLVVERGGLDALPFLDTVGERLAPPPPTLADRIPEVAGCAWWGGVPEGLPGFEGGTPFETIGWWPAKAGEPAVAVSRGREPAPAALESTFPRRPPRAATRVPPDAVVAVGVPLDELARLAAEAEADVHALRALEEASRDLRLPAGSVVGLWFPDDRDDVDFVAVVPVRRAGGGPVPARALAVGIADGLEGAGMTVARSGRRVVATDGRTTLHVRAARGRIAVGNLPDRVDEAARGRGRPWLDAELHERARRWPLVLEIRDDDGETALLAAAGARDGAWEFALHVRDGEAAGALFAFLGELFAAGGD